MGSVQGSQGPPPAGGAVLRSPYPDPALVDADLTSYVLGRSSMFGDRPALVDGITGETITYRDLPGLVAAATTALAGAGVGPGDTVGLMAANQPDWAVTFYALLAAGAAVVPLNPMLTADETAKLAGLAGMSRLIVDAASQANAEAVADHHGMEIATLASTAAPGPTTSSGSGSPSPPASSDAAVVAFSSGTTGQPKGVILTHRNLVANLCQHEAVYHVDSSDVFLAVLPFFHIYGMSIILGYGLRHGATMVTLPRFNIHRYLELIAERRATWLHVAPPVALQLLDAAGPDTDFSSLRRVVSGAAPLDEGVAQRLERRLGCPVGQGYGMTEASPGVTWVPDDGSHPCPRGSVGVLVPGTEARLVSPASGADDPTGGELWVRGPQVMRGYLDDPGATAAAIVDGWLRTGDIVTVDGSGVVRVVDRLKELIKYKGYQVAPAELEAMLLEHPAVSDAAVVGVPDQAAGEIPKAFVVANSPVTAGELMSWAAGRVAPYKKLRAIEFVDSIPKSPSGKILRRQLRNGG